MERHKSQTDPIIRMDDKGNVKVLKAVKAKQGNQGLLLAAKQYEDGEIGPYELVARFLQALALKQVEPLKPKGSALAAWEGDVEITDEDIEEAIADWDAKAPSGARGLLESA